MATASIPHRWKYHVFVSFRGDDIQQSFMDHMFDDFKQKGIHAFRDDNELPKGEEISPNLYKAIEESRFLIVIFSKNYASSSWCFRELVKILKCKQMGKPKHEVQIIFYDVKPNEVRNQTDSYAEAFAKHQVSNSWKEALSMAANLSRWDLQDMANGFESKFIDSISREILKNLCDGPLHVGENLVGIDFHFDKLNLSHFVGSDKVNMIGICGMSGIGKTTLAKAIYNLMYVHFEGSYFCEDVKQVTKQQGLTQVQLHMIRKIMNTDDLNISSVGEGIMVLKKIMSSKPILLVLDDVDDHEQLDALARSPDWFYPGSLIIFTGEDRQLLRSHKVDEIYEMETLKDYEALELFSLCAFEKMQPLEDFEELASQVLIHLQGHPLALKVYGRLLYHKSVYVWKCELDRLRTYSNWGIQQIFRPSFDSLAYDQKRMFLDIACAFIGEKKDIAASVLDSSNCYTNANIEVLVDKFLITVSPSNMSIQMLELIQSMAREIIREEFSMPGNHSRRFWISSEEDILNVNKVAEKVEVLVLLLEKNCQNIPIDGQALKRMKNLRILKICFPKVEGCRQPFAVNFSGRLDLLSNKLRLLYWHGFPLESLPSDFYPENIVAIDLSYSNIKQLWTTRKAFRRLKVMKLRYCFNLTTTPDFSEITDLEELNLEGCVNLVSVHPSIDMLERLLVLNLRYCKRLQNFPSRVVTDSLWVLNPSDDIKITNWQRGELLGRGSFGSVYKGICDGGYFIAVKEVSLLDSGESGRQSVVQLEQEIAMLSQFKHENIVRYYGTDKDESKLYLFLELMTKGSLLSLYQRNHLQDWQVSSYTQQILHGLKYLHDRSIVHRDVKCANILVDANGSVKLADFGLAKATKFNDVRSVKGTAFWMAPEVVNQKNGYGLAADIWSLGCTVLEMLTRRIPYSPMEWMPALLRIGRGIAPPVPDSLSKEARDFIFQCFHVNPRDRPTATQLLDHPFVR